MYFTWNFIILLFGYTGLLWAFPQMDTIGWWLLPVLFALWLFDCLITRRQPRLTAARLFTNPAYQNQPGEITIRITNPLRRPVRLSYQDEPPFAANLVDSLARGKLTVAPGSVATVTYTITCPQRGRFGFGVLNLKYPGVLQLYQQIDRIPLNNATIECYPDLDKISQTPTTSGLTSELSGAHRYRMLWMNGEFAQIREYTGGDDYRKINWNVTAHIGKPVVNQFEPEKDQQIYLLFDTGRLMFDQANDQNRSRMDYILDSGLLLAYNVLSWGDMVGVLGFNTEVERYLPAGKGQHHLQLLVQQFFDLQPVLMESDYREAFRFWQSKVNKRCLLFVYTDLTDTESSRELLDNLKLLSRRHIVVCVMMQKEYLNSALEQPLTSESDAYLKATAWELRQERAKLIQLLGLSGIKVLEVTTANIRQVVVAHYQYLKRRGAI